MITVLRISINFSALNRLHDDSCKKHNYYGQGFKLSHPCNCCSFSRMRIVSSLHSQLTSGVCRDTWSSLGVGRVRKKRVVMVRLSRGFGFTGGSGGRDNSNTARLLINLAFAVALAYLSVNGQLGWLLDAIVSIWLLVVLLPIVVLGAFLWWAGRDIIQGRCPNCGNDFQIFKSFLNDDLQLCPFCSQPFSVVGNEFIRDPVKFSNKSTTFGQAFDEFSPRSNRGKNTCAGVVDVEAEIKDAD